MHAETPLFSLRVSVWDDRRNDPLIAQRQIAPLPDELVHYLLGCALIATGGSIDWVGADTPVRVNVAIEIGKAEIPF